MKSLHRTLAPLVLLIVSVSASAQDINIKSGSTSVVPSPAFGAASGQAGVWNGTSMGGPAVRLVDLSGQPTSAVATASGCDDGGCGDCPFGVPCGAFAYGPDEAALFLKWMNSDCLGNVHTRVAGLVPGTYRVHAYVYHACDPAKTSNLLINHVSASNVILDQTFMTIGGVEYQGTWTGFPIGQATITVEAGQFIDVRIGAGSGTAGGLCGIQLDLLEPTGLTTCFGDGTGAACPCANPGLPGHGCRNSATIRGAELGAIGTSSLAADTLRLACAFEPPNVTSIALQGDQSIAPTFFGDGLRCTGGNLKRLYVVNASSTGDVELPPLAGPSISARSADLGDTIQPGTSRWYQVYYRDPSPTFCPEPQGSTFNVSNAVEISWAP
jgi:hypothetical protein